MKETNTNTSIKFKPLHDNLVVREIKPVEDVSPGGVLLPTVALRQSEESRGVVLAVGPKVRDVKVGDTVLFSRFGCGWDYILDEQNCTVIREVDLIAVENR